MDRSPTDFERPGRLERLLPALALAFYAVALPLWTAALRTGWAAYDEESLLDQVQSWREGHRLIAGFAWGSLYRGLELLLTAAAGPNLALLHLPALAAVLAEAVMLYAWLRGPLGERAALWAALADLVCTATFARGASLLSASLLPAAFLAGALACERLRSRPAALLWGVAAGLMLLDYEGWTGALLFLLPYAAWRRRADKDLVLAAGLGLAAALALVWRLSPDLAGHLLARREVSAPEEGFTPQIWLNLTRLLSPGDRLAISAAANEPWPPPWIWPLVPLGAAAAWRRQPWLAWLLACGSLPLALLNTCTEPHRLCLALLALAAAAGCGAARLWRTRRGAVLCVALLAAGSAAEIRAWVRIPRAKLALTYGTSQNLEEAARWLALNAPPGGWDVITGLGYHNDGAFRFLLASDGVGTRGRDPVALVYWDDLPGLKGLQPGYRVLSFGATRPVSLALLPPADAARLRAVSASVEDAHWGQLSRTFGAQSAATLAWLKAPGHGDPWARTVVWELWLQASLETRQVDLASVQALLAEPLVCGWAPDVLATELAHTRPALALRFRAKAAAVDPRRAAMSFDDRTARY